MACVIIGSIAQLTNTEHVKAILSVGIVDQLLNLLDSENLKTLECVTRAIKVIFRHSIAPRSLIYSEGNLEKFTALLSEKYQQTIVAEAVAITLANCCDSMERQDMLLSRVHLSNLVEMLSSRFPKVKLAN